MMSAMVLVQTPRPSRKRNSEGWEGERGRKREKEGDRE